MRRPTSEPAVATVFLALTAVLLVDALAGPARAEVIELVDKTKIKPTDVVITQRNTPPLFGDGLLDAVSDETLISHQREHSTPARLVGATKS